MQIMLRYVSVPTSIFAWLSRGVLEVPWYLAAEHHMSNLQGAFLLQSGKQIIILCVNFAGVK